MLGLRNLGGEILPVFDLASVLGIEGNGQPKRLLVVEHAARRVAFVVQEILAVDELAGEHQASESAHLQSSIVIDGTLVGVLDVGVLLDMLTGATSEVAP